MPINILPTARTDDDDVLPTRRAQLVGAQRTDENLGRNGEFGFSNFVRFCFVANNHHLQWPLAACHLVGFMDHVITNAISTVLNIIFRVVDDVREAATQRPLSSLFRAYSVVAQGIQAILLCGEHLVSCLTDSGPSYTPIVRTPTYQRYIVASQLVISHLCKSVVDTGGD